MSEWERAREDLLIRLNQHDDSQGYDEVICSWMNRWLALHIGYDDQARWVLHDNEDRNKFMS
jgi:hypothetical protein